MEKRRPIKNLIAGLVLAAVGLAVARQAGNEALAPLSVTQSTVMQPPVTGQAVGASEWRRDENIQWCQGFDDPIPQPSIAYPPAAGRSNQPSAIGGSDGLECQSSGFGYSEPVRNVWGVDQFTTNRHGREARWRNGSSVPWESMAFGEYLGMQRAPHVAEYRLRVNDQLEFVYIRTREKSLSPYRMFVGDRIDISSAIDENLDQTELTIRSDGMVSLQLIGQVLVAGKTVVELHHELNDRYSEFVKNPSIVVRVRDGDKPLDDILDSVDAKAGQGGQGRAATVSPDGTVQLPGIGTVPANGLTLDEIAREVNARYRLRQGGLEVTPILIQKAPQFVYVVGEANRSGRFELTGPTTVMQAVAMAEGFRTGGNLRQVIVFRRDRNWRLTATKLDLAGALYGKRPHPSDEIWLRDSDIVLIPKKPIQRLSEAVDLYLTNTLYSIFPRQALGINFDGFTTL